MRNAKIIGVTGIILALVYAGGGLVVAWVAQAKQAEQAAQLARLTGLGDDQLAELAGVTDAMEPVVRACKDVAAVGADEVIQHLGPAPSDTPAVSGPAGTIGFGRLTGAREGRLVSRPADVASASPGLGALFLAVLTSAPWSWADFVQGPAGDGPPLGGVRTLVVARPTLLPKAAGGQDNPMAGLTVMQVAVLDAGSGKLRCRGGLAAQVKGGPAIEVMALHHLCALGGSELCQLTNRWMDSQR